MDVLDDFQETPLHWACSLGLESIAKMLLRANMSENAKNMQIQTRNADNETALHRAVIQNHPSIVALLLDYHFSLYSNPLLREDGERKEEDEEGSKEEDVMGISYALLYAADYGHTDIVRLLLSYSCPSFHININITDQVYLFYTILAIKNVPLKLYNREQGQPFIGLLCMDIRTSRPYYWPITAIPHSPTFR